MIKIGVTENVYVSDQKLNDKGTLEVTISEIGNVKKKASLLDQMNESSDESGSSSGSTPFLFFMPSREYQNEPVEPAKQVLNLVDFKNQMHHFLKRSMTESKIKWNILKGIVLKTEDELLDKIQDENTYKKIYTNICEQFIEQAKANINDPSKPSRLLLVRQSAEKAFGSFRKKFLGDQPFWESMEIPKDKSKLWVKAGSKGATTVYEATEDGYVPNFTSYEIGKGLDNWIPSSNKADAASNTPEEAAQVEGIFGGGAAQQEAPMDFSATPSFGAPETASEVPGLNAPQEGE